MLHNSKRNETKQRISRKKVKFIYFCALEKHLHNEIAAILWECGELLRISFVLFA